MAGEAANQYEGRNMNTLYDLEYRLTRCLQCSKPLAEHRLFTQADIDAAKGATYEKPVNGHWSPLSPSLIGKWWVNGHAPMPWPEAIEAGFKLPDTLSA